MSQGSDSVSIQDPVYRGHVLLGDSQLVRFSLQVLGYLRRHCTQTETGNLKINHAVSGQTTQGLYDNLSASTARLPRKVILLIGSNDLRNDVPISRIKHFYDCIVDLLRASCDRVVLVTVPPTATKAADPMYWDRFRSLNMHIAQKADGSKIFVVDLASHMLSMDGTINVAYLERTYSSGRQDLVHLNLKGFKLLKFLLDVHYFDD